MLHSDVSTAQSYGAGARPPTATERPEPLLLHDTRMSAERGRLRKTTNKDAAIKVTGEPCTRCPAFSSAKTPQCLPALPSRALHSELRPPLFFRATIVSCLSCPFLSSDSSLGFEGKAEGESCNVTAEWAPAPLACQGEGRGAAELRTYRDRRKALWPPREDQDLLCLVLTFGGRWAPPLAGRGDNNSTKYWGSGCSGQQAGQAAIISRAVSDSRCIA